MEPSRGLSCQNYGVCATRDSCPHWEQKSKELANAKGSPAYKNLLQEFKSAICNRADKGLCCPYKGKNNLEVDLRGLTISQHIKCVFNWYCRVFSMHILNTKFCSWTSFKRRQ